MQTNKSVSSNDEVVPSTDKTALLPNETVSPADDMAASNDETISSPNGIISSDDEIVSSPNEPTLANDATVSPTLEVASSPNKTLSQSEESVLSSEPRQTWRAFVEPWWKATLAILPTFLITRFIFLLLSYFGGVLFFVKNYVTTVIPFHTILYRWYYWDAKRFADIATHGYTSLDYAAFFPLYPALVHAFTVLTHRDVLESSMFISNVAFLGMLIVLYRFVAVEFDKETAQRTALYISIFPTALFFFAGYNESLFLFLTLICFYTIRRGSWWLAGLFGLLAALTRSSGIFLALIFVCEYLRQNWPLLQEVWQNKQFSRMLRPLLTQLSAVLLIPLGLAIYSYGLHRRFNDALAFIHAQKYWREGLTFPLYAPLATLKKIVTLPLFTFVTPHNIIDFSAAVLFATLLVLCFVGPEKIKRSQWTFPLFGLVILVTTMLYPTLPSQHGMYDPLASTQRLVLEAFVGFIILARYGRRPWFNQLYLLISLPLLAFLTLQFMTGHWTV
jgi:Gpi18-like mannosyltransferase